MKKKQLDSSFTAAEVIVGAAILLSIFCLGLRRIGGSDTFWHIATGEYILSTLSIPRTDPFTFTMADRSWIPTEWLSGVIFALIFKIGGFPGIVVFTSLAYSACLLILGVHARASGRRPWVMLSLLAIVGVDRLQHCLPRPQIFTYVLLAYFSLTIHQFLSGRTRRLWHIPFLVILWENLHAGALSGLALLGIVGTSEWAKKLWGSPTFLEWPRLRHLSFVFISSFFSLILNPNGYGMISWAVSHPEVNKALGNVEFLSMSFSDPSTRTGLILMCTLGVSMAMSWRAVGFRDILVISAFLFPALWMRRAGAEFFIVAFPAFVAHASLGMDKILPIAWRKRGAVLSILAPPIMLAGMAAARLSSPLFLHSLGFGVDPAFYPRSAISFVRSSLLGPVFNSIMLGGAFILEAYPQHKAFWDTRLHGDIMYLDAIRTIRGDPARFQEFLGKYGIEICLVEAELKGFSRDMFPRQTWALVYWDDWAVVFAKRTGVNASAIKEYEYSTVDPVSILPPPSHLAPQNMGSLDKEIRRDLAVGPPSGRALTALAQISAKEGRIDDAIRDVTRAIAINPTLASAHNSLGTYLASKGDFHGAIDAFKEALQWNPGFVKAHINMGALYAKEGFPQKALDEFERALAIDPHSSEVHLYSGLVLVSINERKGALTHLTQSLRLDPQQERAEEIRKLIQQIK